MPKTRDILRLSRLDLHELNFLFQRIADRLDKLEGLRGAPAMSDDLTISAKLYVRDADGNLIHSQE